MILDKNFAFIVETFCGDNLEYFINHARKAI